MAQRENDDRFDDPALADEIVTNDAVAGETVFSGDGEGNDGPTGGSPREGEPDWEHYAPGVPETDDAQPFGAKAPSDLRGDVDGPRSGEELDPAIDSSIGDEDELTTY